MFLLLFSLSAGAQVARDLEAESIVEQKYTNKDTLLSRYHHLLTEPGLVERGKPGIYTGENLKAIQFPVGGIGTGCIQYDGNAVARYWQIFNNMSHEYLPNSFFAIRVKNNDKVQVRALQTENMNGFSGMDALKLTSAFPFIKYEFTDDLPVDVSMEVFNPFIPTDLKNSGIPAVFYRFTFENNTDKKLDVSLLASQQNAVGLSRLPNNIKGNSFAERFINNRNRKLIEGNNSHLYGKNINSFVSSSSSNILYMEGNAPRTDEHFGQMALILFDNKKTEGLVQGAASWGNTKKDLKRFKEEGQIKTSNRTKASKQGTTWTGAINAPMVLMPGEKVEIEMALAWYFPNGKNGGHLDKWDSWGNGKWEGIGNYYANSWSDITDLVNYITENYLVLLSQSQKFRDNFYKTNLPYWLIERIGSQLSILKSRTIFHDKNGFVGLWEGSGASDGSCAGNCNHVWHYAQAHARLFPELARAVKEQSFAAIKENGQIPYRLPAGSPAFDGQCGDILGAYREYLLSSDSRWLQSQYPAIKKAILYLINTHDQDGDGWLSGLPKHTTYDASMTGNPSFLTSLYLATLRAGDKMAMVANDTAQARVWRKIAGKSQKLQDEKLWNGEYFIQIPGKKRATDYETGCMSDQLLGQWWADQLGLGDLYPAYKIKSATEAILKYNFKSILKDYIDITWRKFALPEEAGMLVATWPEKDRPSYACRYSEEAWTTFEYNTAAMLLKYDNVKDAFTILRAGDKRYDGKLKSDYESKGKWGNFGFSGNPFGDDECGQFYGRALSNWSVLLAAQGFDYDGPNKTIGFNPKWKPENHCSFFTTAQGWGNFFQQRSAGLQENSIELSYGKLELKQIRFHVPASFVRPSVVLKINEKAIKFKLVLNNGQATIECDQLVLNAGDTLQISFIN